MDAAKLSPHFALTEFTRSQTATRSGIPNIPTSRDRNNLVRLCETVLEPLRVAVGPLVITSGYRSPALNKRIGGSRNSQHTMGCAADVVSSKYDPLGLCRIVIDLHLPFDQLIWEGDWMHVSIAETGTEPRGEVLTAHFGQGVRYTPGLPQVR